LIITVNQELNAFGHLVGWTRSIKLSDRLCYLFNVWTRMFKRYLRNNDITLDTKDIVEMIVIIWFEKLESAFDHLVMCDTWLRNFDPNKFQAFLISILLFAN
jgi:hypothetical protein